MLCNTRRFINIIGFKISFQILINYSEKLIISWFRLQFALYPKQSLILRRLVLQLL